jgi:hypothetical protein
MGILRLALSMVTGAVLMQAAVAAQPPFRAGRWEHSILLSPDGNYWLPTTQNQGCLTAAQAQDVTAEVRQQLELLGCAAKALRIADGQISATLACTDPSRTRVIVTGRYTDRSYALDFRSDGPLDLAALGGIPGLPVQLIGRASGQRLGPC